MWRTIRYVLQPSHDWERGTGFQVSVWFWGREIFARMGFDGTFLCFDFFSFENFYFGG